MSGVSASEAGPAPDCPCHSEAMRWSKDARKACGGNWSCAVKHRTAVYEPNRRRRATPRGRAYMSWWHARARCTDPVDGGWPNYGGRGIAMCDRWLRSFEAFLADMGGRPEGLTLDRIDNDGDYEPGNCRWATPKEQRANRRAPAGAGA